MISFELIKKWIKDHSSASEKGYLEDFKIPDKDLIGDWTYLNENICYKFIETTIMYYKRRLLIMCKITENEDGTTELSLISAEEVALQ